MREDEFDTELDLDLLKAWLTIRFNPSSKCFLSRRREKVNAARKLVPDDFKTEKFKGSGDSVARELLALLFDIVRSVTSDVPREERVGVLSSGGIDSTTVMTILCKLGYRPEAFTIGFGTQNDEVESASRAAEFVGVEHRIKILDRILDSTVVANSVLDEPYRAACFYYEALKFARDSGVRYVFDGLGVDEFFGGYAFRYRRVTDFVNSGMGRLDAYLRGSNPNDYVVSDSELFGDKLRSRAIDWDALLPYFGNDLSLLDQLFLADYNAKCRQNFIPLASFARPIGIRILYPWLDNRFVDFSMRVPADWKYDPGTGKTKILFRLAVQGLVPESTMAKEKQGFGPAPGRVYEELRPLAEDMVLDGLMASNGYVNREYYRKVLENKAPSSVEVNKLWDLYTLEHFLDNVKL